MIEYLFVTNPTVEQISQLTQLYRDAGWWGEDPDCPAHIRAIVSGSHCFVAAIHENTVIGMGRAISDRASDGYLQDVTVRKDWRRKGVGARIVSLLTERLNRDGIFWIYLIAEGGTVRFYEASGFEQRPGWVPMKRVPR